MAINTNKVVVGGLVAGLVITVVNYVVFAFLLRSRLDAELLAAAPSLQGKGMGPGSIAAHVISDFVLGILLVWIYAAIRPRFGPGMGTAAKAAIVIWICGLLFHQDWLHMGMTTVGSYVMVAIAMLVSLNLAAGVGGKLYTEGGAPSMA